MEAAPVRFSFPAGDDDPSLLTSDSNAHREVGRSATIFSGEGMQNVQVGRENFAGDAVQIAQRAAENV